MHDTKKIILPFFVFLLCFCRFANAYIDPGTGGLIINSAWSYIVGIIGIVAGFLMLKIINPVKNYFKNKKSKSK